MNVIKPSATLVNPPERDALYKHLESCGRTCYKSEDKITEDSAERFLRTIVKSGHTSVLEHAVLSVRFVCDRGVSHEIVRHRLAAYSQESTRYCNYSKDKFDNQLTFIKPMFWDTCSDEYGNWIEACAVAESIYLCMVNRGVKPEEARSILPNSLKTELVMTADITEWRHFFKMRCSKAAHPQIREIAIPLLTEMQHRYPALFDDIRVDLL